VAPYINSRNAWIFDISASQSGSADGLGPASVLLCRKDPNLFNNALGSGVRRACVEKVHNTSTPLVQ
jgi:hypothetical protein